MPTCKRCQNHFFEDTSDPRVTTGMCWPCEEEQYGVSCPEKTNMELQNEILKDAMLKIRSKSAGTRGLEIFQIAQEAINKINDLT